MPGPNDPHPDSDHAAFGELVFAVSRLWRRAANQKLDQFDLSHATAAPLLALKRLGGRARQGVIAEEAGLEGPSMVRLMDLLVEDGLVTRAEDSTDRRAKIVSLTPAGMERLQAIHEIIDPMREDLISGIEPAALRAAVQVLRTVEERLEVRRPPVKTDDA
ncbi:MarR family winged helix-turn-helix transcriptional regulator [Mesorhizobium australicum]|uniref:MarR family transcriptional regulator, transcriptional regulator for hemolysin n=1 Tax=Mesorhizobium australicum TaxID=536018 RepID=A0A1X7N3D9_9HYPH|nr:MarR family winged helix-turn-helix transcriptional regulator [Mesorhizobium australicum]SMH31865.1 MarR family transcriptional regulator, transcriptional regulator for hemolysin [Mesorhizobium australicum]